MKVFLSHQQADSIRAASVAYRLRTLHQIDSYLDVVDPDASSAGERVGEHIRSNLATCDTLLALVSTATRLSWWVPWEIGVATEKAYPLATYAVDGTELPLYLKKWPYLRSDSDLDVYANSIKAASTELIRKRVTLTENTARREAVNGFYATIRKGLGQ